MIPEPLMPAGPIVKYEFIKMPNSSGLGNYMETGQVIPVTLNGKPGSYTRRRLLNNNPAVSPAGKCQALVQRQPVTIEPEITSHKPAYPKRQQFSISLSAPKREMPNDAEHNAQFYERLMVQSTNRQRVIVVGGGAGGLELITKLSQRPPKRKLDLVLVDRARTHIWQPLLHEVATGSLDATSLGHLTSPTLIAGGPTHGQSSGQGAIHQRLYCSFHL